MGAIIGTNKQTRTRYEAKTVPKVKGGPITLPELKGTSPTERVIIENFFYSNGYQQTKTFVDNYIELQAVFRKHGLPFPDEIEVESFCVNEATDEFVQELVNTAAKILDNAGKNS